nr:hypothetical protein [Tanacetum cinerariifolium]
MVSKTNVNDMITKMEQNKNNFQTIFKSMERKIDEWEKSQNVFSKQTDRTGPPPPQAHTEQVNVVFNGSKKSNDPPNTQKDPPLSILVKNKTKKDKPIKTSKRAITCGGGGWEMETMVRGRSVDEGDDGVDVVVAWFR